MQMHQIVLLYTIAKQTVALAVSLYSTATVHKHMQKGNNLFKFSNTVKNSLQS